ncbi:MAG TPA: glutamine-hydrolyzing carbamoyl-phosphate synthase small subunit [Planctomycetota bacterium]|nr:glutamine-hydrolyzing carbamoyl-phosphate synthase small subunit [Planctomycetota bacterium]
MPVPARLVLEDGAVYRGRAFGARVDRTGEVVFNTAMSGYQEILTDPSYTGQIVTMTYPLQGNYGVNAADVESNRPQVEGFVARELSTIRSNYRSDDDLSGYLQKAGVPGIDGIDTRQLTRKLRTAGVMRGILACSEASAKLSDADLVDRARSSPQMEGWNLAAKVSCTAPYDWNAGFVEGFSNAGVTVTAGRGRGEEGGGNCFSPPSSPFPPPRFKVVCIDYGIKTNILRCLVDTGADVTVLPASATATDVLARKPDGVFLSNGPGDPAAVTGAPDLIRGLAGKVPMFGICLGHQLMGLAFGGRTYKLKFGHRGANQPVFEERTGKVEITSQNHGFAVDPESLPKNVQVTHINLNDKTVEGLAHKDFPAFSVQYHPEASPGPHDSFYLFGRFRDLILKK